MLSTLANELITKFEISILTFYKSDVFYELDPRISILNCANSPLVKSGAVGSIINNLHLLFQLTKNLKKENSDIVIGFMTTANILSVIAANVLGIPSIISERNHPEYRKLNKFWSRMRRIFYKKSTKLVVQTDEIKAFFKGTIPDSKLVIIKNPISPTLAQSRLKQQKKENIILNVGRLEDQKNQGLLIDAFYNLKLPDWHIQFIGEGSNKNAYLQKVKSLNLLENISFIGNVKNIETYYNSAKIFVFTSNYEGFPNALTEALYFGVPSISTNCPSGPSELIEHGHNGFLIPMGDTKALEIAIKKLVEDHDLRAKISDQAMISTKKYEVQTIARQWEQLITKLLHE